MKSHAIIRIREALGISIFESRDLIMSAAREIVNDKRLEIASRIVASNASLANLLSNDTAENLSSRASEALRMADALIQAHNETTKENE